MKLAGTFIVYIVFVFAPNFCLANNITVTNVTLTGQNTDAGTDNAANYTMVQFDISWENSWRTGSAPNNWDAAWVFIKFRVGSGDWDHAWLNDTGHNAPSGSSVDVGLLDPGSSFDASTNPGIGVFIYRDANGSGTFSKTGVQLRWNYGRNGVSDDDLVDVSPFAVEMVYVPQGSFYIGDDGNSYGIFHQYDGSDSEPDLPYNISSEGSITVGTTSGNLWYRNERDCGDQSGPIPSAFPKGYNAFYCMKYEITQQQYVDFLNMLDRTQQQARTKTSVSGTSVSDRFVMSRQTTVVYRQGIRCDASLPASPIPVTFYCDLDGDGTGGGSNDGSWIASSYLNWGDLTAILDWMALRPLTELEYEKACRGPSSSVGNEYAWGVSSTVSSFAYTLSSSGANDEFISTGYSATVGNSNYGDGSWAGTGGPFRVGIFATSSSNRIESGATYYGIMEMSGNLWEQFVTVGHSDGRSFTGTHGDGLLDSNGDPDVSNWPTSSDTGISFRGGTWANSLAMIRISNRYYGAVSDWGRDGDAGGRGGRSE